MKVGDEFKLVFIPVENHRSENIRGVITKVECVKFKNLTNVHADNEGYQHIDLLKHELRNIYPDIRWDSECYIYQFVLINLGGVILNDTDKIKEIKKVFRMFHEGEDENGFELDTIDVCMII